MADIVEMLDDIMKDCAVTDKIAYAERIAKDRIDVLISHKLVEVKDKSVVAVDVSGKQKEIESDTVVMAVGYNYQHDLYDQLMKEDGIETFSIGDCVAPGKIYDAIHTAYKTALKI